MASERRRLLVGTGWTFASTLTVLTVGLVLRPVTILFVGVSGYGIWVSSVAIASLAGLLGDFGASGALTRVVAERDGKHEPEGTAMTSSLLFGLLSGGIAGFGLIGLASSIEGSLGFSGLASLLQLHGAQLPLNLGIATLLGRLQGRRNFRLLAAFSIGNAVGNFVLALSFLAIGLGLVGLVLASFVSSAAVFVGALAHARSHLVLGGLWASMKRDVKLLIPFGATLTATNALSTLLYQLDIVVLIVLLGDPASVGIYAIAILVTRALWIIPGSISVTTYPTVSGYAAAGDDRRLSMYLKTTLVATIALTAAQGAALAAFGKPLIVLLFGSDASTAYELALLLLPGTAALGSLRSIAASIPAVGRPDVGFAISAIGLSLLLVGLVALVPLAGGSGAAVAVSVSHGVIAGMLVWAVGRYVRKRAYPRSEWGPVLRTTGVACFSSAICIAVALPVSFNSSALIIPTLVWATTIAALYITSGGRTTWGDLLRRVSRTTTGELER